MKKNVVHKKKISSVMGVFFLFILLAFILVLALEYLDHKKGKPTIFFPSPETVEKKQSKTKDQIPLQLQWSAIFSNDIELTDRFTDENQVEHLNLRISETRLDSFRNRLRTHVTNWGAQLSLVEISKKDDHSLLLFHVFKNHIKTHIILVFSIHPLQETQSQTPIRPPKQQNSMGVQKTVAIIIDDIGSRANIISSLKSLKIPITVSILVDEPYAASEVLAAAKANIETMIHLPMQPHNGQSSPRHKVITPETTTFQIREILEHSRRVVPKAKGANNHQGSLTTSNRNNMISLLTVLKENGLYFIDSRTTAASVAYTMAQEFGVKSSYRDLFIDHIQTLEHSREQFSRLFELLQKKNTILMIGHPHDTTIQAIREAIPKLQKMNVRFVYASDIIH